MKTLAERVVVSFLILVCNCPTPMAAPAGGSRSPPAGPAGNLPVVSPPTLELNATWGGQPLDAFYRISTAGQSGHVIETGRTSTSQPTKLPLAPGTYRIVIEDDGATGKPTVVFDDVPILGGILVQKTAAFEGGTLNLDATANGDPLDAFYEVFTPGDDGERIATGRTGAHPTPIRLSPGTYRIVVEDDAAADSPIHTFEDVQIEAGGTAERIAAFEEGTFMLSATLDAWPVSAFYRVLTSGDDGFEVASGWSSESGTSLRLSPDHYRVVVQVLTVVDHPSITNEELTIEAEQTVQQTAAFYSGTLELKATLDGKPLDTWFRILTPGDQGTLVTSGHTTDSGVLLRLTPGYYRVVVMNRTVQDCPTVISDVHVMPGTTIRKTAAFGVETNQVVDAGVTSAPTNNTAEATVPSSTNSFASTQPADAPPTGPAVAENHYTVTVIVAAEKAAESGATPSKDSSHDTRSGSPDTTPRSDDSARSRREASPADTSDSDTGRSEDSSRPRGGGTIPGSPPARDPLTVVLLGNHQFAWESGDQAPSDVKGADLCWTYVSASEQYLVPLNGARMAVITGHERTPIEQLGNVRALLPAQSFSRARIPGGTTPGSLVNPGTRIAMITGEGDHAVLEIVGFRSSRDVSFPEADTLGDARGLLLQQPEKRNYHLQIRGLWARSPKARAPRGQATEHADRAAPPARAGDRVMLLGAHTWDVESHGSNDRSARADFLWQHISPTERYLVPINGTRAALVTNGDFEAIGAAFVRAYPMSDGAEKISGARATTTKFSGSDTGSVLQPGAILVFRTAEGNYGKLVVEGYRSLHDFSFPEAASLKQDWKDFVLKKSDTAHYHMQVRRVLFGPEPQGGAAQAIPPGERRDPASTKRASAPEAAHACAGCGAALKGDENFCPHCGAKVNRTATTDKTRP